MWLAQLTASAGDGVAVESANASQQRNTTAAVEPREQTNDKPAGAFIGSGDEAVDRTVFSGNAAAGMVSAGWARAGMHD